MISDIEDAFTVVEKNVRPKLSLVGHVSKHRQIVIFSTGIRMYVHMYTYIHMYVCDQALSRLLRMSVPHLSWC